MSQPEVKKNLHAMRQTLREREKALKESQSHLENREAVQAAIASLSLRLNDQQRKLIEPSESDQEALRLLKKKKLELDHWLDAVEDISEDILEAERQTLTHLILESRPDQVAPYQQLQAEKHTIAASLTFLQSFIATGDDLMQYLDKIIAEGQSMRRGGLLRYIMGLNPNLVVLSCLNAIKSSSEHALKLLENIPDQTLSPDQVEALIQSLTALHASYSKKWAWRTLPREFQLLKDSWNQQMIMLQDNLNIIFEHRIKNSQQIDRWLFDL